MNPSPEQTPLRIGSLLFPQLDQLDFTGPFEVFSRLPGASLHLIGKEKKPLRDARGLLLVPEQTLAEAPPLDVLHLPGGPGQEALMDDEVSLAFLREQAAHARCVFSVCTGALLLGAAGLLMGRKATTHWASFHLLPYFAAVPVNERVVKDGKLVTTAGVTAGLDGALQVAALLCGDQTAQAIQLDLHFAPEPPFGSGTPESAPPEVLQCVRAGYRALTEARLATARRLGAKLGVPGPEQPGPMGLPRPGPTPKAR